MNMAELLQFPDRVYRALHNAGARTILSLAGMLNLLAEELGPTRRAICPNHRLGVRVNRKR